MYIYELKFTYVIVSSEFFHDYCHLTFTPGNAHLKCKCFNCMKTMFSDILEINILAVFAVTRAVFRESFPLKCVHDSTRNLSDSLQLFILGTTHFLSSHPLHSQKSK